ncbi:MAG: glycogen debranching enzyme family protein [Bacteroidales bacterium]|nr:glycogen debranching enzyme family protein [Bacteroidales bacterium]
MGYIEFDKNELVNLEYSLSKELIRSNRMGSFATTTIVGCNTRKYHGLLIVRQPEIDHELHVLLSSLDVTVIQRNAEFNLGIHKYRNNLYNPKGHKYIRDFRSDPIPHLTYTVGGVVLTVERVFSSIDDRILIRYSLVEAHSPTKLRLRPFLAFRQRHMLSSANSDVRTGYDSIPNGIMMSLYPNYTPVYMQFSKQVEYHHAPDWYFGLEYDREEERGYDFKEDLWVPGYFELDIKKGESVMFSAGISGKDPSTLKRLFSKELRSRTPRDSFEHCLHNSGDQFVIRRNGDTEIIAGYPWFDVIGRDTFISIPGLMLTRNDHLTFFSVIDTMVRRMKGPFFPDYRKGNESFYESADTSLWFIWALQQYVQFTGDRERIRKRYGELIRMILSEYRKGTSHQIHMQEDGLLGAGIEGKPVTWMNAVVEGMPVTPRTGLAVDLNALWYHAIMFTLDLFRDSKYQGAVSDWLELARSIPASFMKVFWNEEKGYLADVVYNGKPDWSFRPNQIFTASLLYSPVPEDVRKKVFDHIESELLTIRGLRSLAPDHPEYRGIYEGSSAQRDTAYHQGSVFPWMLGHFAEGYLRLHGRSGLPLIRKLYYGFEDELAEHGVGSISEIYDGDPPHRPRGSISQAWSVAELLRMKYLIDILCKHTVAS